MANLNANPAWKDVNSGNAKNNTSIVGPTYSYTDNLPTPTSMGVGDGGSFGQLYTNLGATTKYIGIMTAGDKPLGDSYFINTGGTCTAPDGSTRSRMNFVNNVSNGLLPGVLSDIGGLNPSYLFTAMSSDATPACSCYSCPTTTGTKYGFLTPEMTPDFNPNICTVVDSSNCIKKESFMNSSSSALPIIVAVVLLGLLTFSGKKTGTR